MPKKKKAAALIKKQRNRLHPRRRPFALALPTAGALTFVALPAHALNVYHGPDHGNNVEITLNIGTSFSSFYRVNDPSAILAGAGNAQGNDGDANLRHGFVGNVFEVLPVLDIKDGTLGAHFSGEYFLNTTYLGTTQNNQPGTLNPVVPKGNDFASQTRLANGNNGRLLDAFVYDSFTFGGDQVVAIKAGQQTLFWGQSLYFGQNGIAGGQAPIDAIAAQDTVNAQSQQIFLPVGQIVLTYQPNDIFTFQGYYQYQWVPDSLQGVGSYFSTSDVTGPGAQRIVAVSGTTMTNGFYFYNTKALTPPSQNGQFGLSVQAQLGDYDVGLYGLRYDSKAPTVYETIGPFDLGKASGASIGSYRLVYPRDIQLYGASVSTTIGATNVAGEVSGRRNMNLVGAAAPITLGGNPGGANNDALYPVGNTLTFLSSAIYGSPSLSFDPGGVTVTGEVEYVHLLGVTANKAALAPGRSSSAAAFDVQVEPAYFNVWPNVELQFPVSLTYDFAGNSQVDSTMNHGTGEFTAGVVVTYKQNWSGSLNYVDYLGRPGLSNEPNVSQLADRGYITFNLQHTF
jgi:hypothetical protein